MAVHNFSGFVYSNTGVAVVGATVDIFTRNTLTAATTVPAAITTDGNGYWTATVAVEGRYDIRITSGTAVRWRKYDDQIQLQAIEASVIEQRNPANTFNMIFTMPAITADRVLNWPLITGTDTLAALGLAQDFTARQGWAKTADIASVAAITPLNTGNYSHITGTTTITSIATRPAGDILHLEFDGALTLTHNGTSLILQGAANLVTAAGDMVSFVSEGSGNWRELSRRLAAAASAAAVVRVGGNTTDTATTSTSAVDLLSAASLSIATNVPVKILVAGRKTSGAASAAGLGLKVNATTTGEASTSVAGVLMFDSVNAAEARYSRVMLGPRITDYNTQGSAAGLAAGLADTAVGIGTAPVGTAAQPIATVTDIVIRGITTTLVTVAADELHVFTMGVA